MNECPNLLKDIKNKLESALAILNAVIDGGDIGETSLATSSASSKVPANVPSSTPADGRKLDPISVLKLAKGWEEKLISAGVSTVGELGEYISDGCLKPGCLPRVGPEAVEKIRAAYQEHTGEILLPSAGASTPTQESTPTPTPAPDACYAEGKRFAEAGAKAIENPHPKGTALWASWDRGWQETFAEMDVDDEATREEIGSVEPSSPAPEPTPTAGPEIPDLDLSPSAGASPAPSSAAAPDDEFDDL